MLFIISMKDFDMNHFYFLETNKNSEPIPHEKEAHFPFIRIIYSTRYYSMNNICVHIPLKISKFEKIYDKHKCTFSVVENEECVRFIYLLESSILNHFFNKKYNQDKSPLFRLTEQINSGEIKAYHSDNHLDPHKTKQLILKISGIWSSFDIYGVTYKYMYMKNIIY
jgi:hypothetical protein